MIKNALTERSVLVKESKIPNHWSSAVPKKYNRIAILGALHGAHKISTNFEHEKRRIKKKYFSVNFPYNFIQSIFNSCQQKRKTLFLTGYLKKNKEKQFTLEYLFVYQINIMR